MKKQSGLWYSSPIRFDPCYQVWREVDNLDATHVGSFVQENGEWVLATVEEYPVADRLAIAAQRVLGASKRGLDKLQEAIDALDTFMSKEGLY